MRPGSIIMGDSAASADQPRQLSFDWLAPATMRGHNRQKLSKLLLMTKPPSALSETIFNDAQIHALGRTTRSAYPAELLHVSLLCIGAFQTRPDRLIARLKTVLQDFSAHPIPMTMDTAAHFGNRKSLALKSASVIPEMTCLTQMLQTRLRSRNLPHICQSTFTPHMTIIYGCGEIEPMRVSHAYCWTVSDFELVFSHYGETLHEQCGRWRLQADRNHYRAIGEQMKFPQWQ
ncbi:2'-5' RNA ligase [Agrobacterium rosae]|nr:2'-5' RNA ligase [Agrobacterium rosae]KAA3517983.1 2'-5' RNA ligase [Agrobacterium rosae]MQB49544.1 2'-5' RNA ligase [Agrobacterium rosae]